MRKLMTGSVVAAFISGMSLTASAQLNNIDKNTFVKNARNEALQILFTALESEDHAVISDEVIGLIEECLSSRINDPHRGLGFCSTAIHFSEPVILHYFADNDDEVLSMLHISLGISLYKAILIDEIKENPGRLASYYKEYMKSNLSLVEQAREYVDIGLKMSPDDYTGLTYRSILSNLIGDRGAQSAEDLFRACRIDGEYVNSTYDQAGLCAKLIRKHRENAMTILERNAN